MKKNIIIIGGGIGGLATAALLGKDGHKVTLIEKNRNIGGRASSWKSKGFTFDLGPSWYMMPDVFEKYFALFGKKVTDYYSLLELNPRYKVFIGNKSFTLHSDLKQNFKLFDSVEKDGGKKLNTYLKTSEQRYNLAMNKLVYFDYSSPFQVISKDLISNIFSLGLQKNFHTEIAEQFTNPYLQKILEFVTVFLGGSPYITPAFYTLISHTDFSLKIWHPKGGIYKVIEAFQRLCIDNNVKIKTNESVIQINTKNNIAQEVVTNKKKYKADIVISNADYAFTETKLLEKQFQTYPKKYWDNQVLSPSALLIYIGINTKLKHISHHNLYFNEHWENDFTEVYKNPKWPKLPSYYVNIPSVTDKTVAPKNSETIIFLVPLSPHLKDKGSERELLAERIIQHFESMIGQQISKNIVTKRLFSHRDFNTEYNSYKGAAFGIAHTLFQTGPFRPKNKSKKIKNLYYVGQYTNPGIGLPPCVISAQIVHNLISNEK